MLQKNTLMVFFLLFIVAIIVGIVVYVFQRELFSEMVPQTGPSAEEEAPKLYEGTVEGTITMLVDEETGNEIATIATSDGNEFLLWPPRPSSFYKDKGINNGDQVTIQGKVLEGGRLYVESIK